jgi:signal transduction histidine kinase
VEALTGEALQETLDRLHLQVAELRASRRRLVAAAAADRRLLERHLHEGVQQHLIALAVTLQLARDATETNPAAARTLLDELERDVQRALDETAQLAQRVYPPLLEAGGLAAALRAAAVSAGIRGTVEVAATASYSLEVAWTIYASCLDALEHAGAGTSVCVREESGGLAFEVVEPAGDGTAARPAEVLERLRDRVEALGGSLTVGVEPGGGTRLAGRLPLAR